MVTMNSAHLSLRKARALATRLRPRHHDGRGWTGSVDRDLVRETHDIYLLAQATGPTLH
jgi:hypothetical protein